MPLVRLGQVVHSPRRRRSWRCLIQCWRQRRRFVACCCHFMCCCCCCWCRWCCCCKAIVVAVMLALLAFSGLFWELRKNARLHYKEQQLPLLPLQLLVRHICLGSPLQSTFCLTFDFWHTREIAIWTRIENGNGIGLAPHGGGCSHDRRRAGATKTGGRGFLAWSRTASWPL